MLNNIGLYYPSVGFMNDAWIKFVALYWDRLGRIVPQGHIVDDSATVKQLIDELGFIECFAPSESELALVGEMFVTTQVS
jgi:hypothetical protein